MNIAEQIKAQLTGKELINACHDQSIENYYDDNNHIFLFNDCSRLALVPPKPEFTRKIELRVRSQIDFF